MRLHSYVVARDFGFAPNPFHGVCTLATCKPIIRRVAGVEDWVVGTGSAAYGLRGRLVFAMQVDETLTYDEYWSDGRFEVKKPTLVSGRKRAFGDNIYHRDAISGEWIQENSHHSLADGRPNARNIAHDTQSLRVLIARRFSYFGGSGPLIPRRFRGGTGEDVCAGRGHRSVFTTGFVDSFIRWLAGLDEGYIGAPAEWARIR